MENLDSGNLDMSSKEDEIDNDNDTTKHMGTIMEFSLGYL